jgi:thioredoxin 1
VKTHILLMAALPLVGLLLPMAIAGSQTKTEKDIYPAPEAAPGELKAALAKAANLRKRVILDFGGNWCEDCRVLDKYFHQEPNASLLKESFILVDVNIGNGDKNLDIAKTYGVPLEKGVPALAVLDSQGKVLFSQKKGEFESMRRMDTSVVTDFLKHWKR